MAYLSDIVTDFVEKLSKSEEMAGVKIVTKFPYGIKPTEIDKAVVSVGLKNIKLSNSSLGEDDRSGNYTISAKIFVPFKMGGFVTNSVFCRICKVMLMNCDVVACKCGETLADEKTSSYVLECEFDFEDEFNFGGATNG